MVALLLAQGPCARDVLLERGGGAFRVASKQTLVDRDVAAMGLADVLFVGDGVVARARACVRVNGSDNRAAQPIPGAAQEVVVEPRVRFLVTLRVFDLRLELV